MDPENTFLSKVFESSISISPFTPINDTKMPDIKLELNDTAGFLSDEMDESLTPLRVKTEQDTELAAPASTPRKRGRKAGENNANAEGGAEEATPTKKGKTGKAGKTGKGDGTPKKQALGPVPSSFETASVSDRLVIRMRDEEGRGWADITSAWSSMTGLKVDGSTLRKRYTAMKANFVSLTAEDEGRLFKFKKEIEDKMENEKWTRIADSIEADGGSKYPPAALQKKFKELSKGTNAAVKDEE